MPYQIVVPMCLIFPTHKTRITFSSKALFRVFSWPEQLSKLTWLQKTFSRDTEVLYNAEGVHDWGLLWPDPSFQPL